MKSEMSKKRGTKREIRKLEAGSMLIGRLPEGCKHCRLGAKVVLLVTGICSRRCFYCPLSEQKMKKDVMYANELKVEDETDYLKESINEAHSIDAKGAGITGGDPLVVPKRTISLIEGLKKEFGKDFHIHLYTAVPFEERYIDELSRAGLDEIRFHPPENIWSKMEGSAYDRLIRKSKLTDMDVGVEIPLIPGSMKIVIMLAKYLDKIGVNFLNLNELEFSETNFENLRKREYEVVDDVSSAVAGSYLEGEKILEHFATSKSSRLERLSIHLCTSSFKDSVQLKKRLERRARKTARAYHEITEEGIFRLGIIECDDKTFLKEIEKRMKEKYEVPEDMVRYDEEKGRLETAFWILEELAHALKRIKGKKIYLSIIEEYPTADRLETERIPI